MNVGDKVQFGADIEGFPIWDMDDKREDFDHLNTGQVDRIEDETIIIEFFDTDGDKHAWFWPKQPPAIADEYWLRPADSRPALAFARSEPVWVEIVKVRRKAEVPDIIVSQMIDRGERGIRRSLREWPYGKSLKHHAARQPGDLEDTFQIHWYWEEAAW